jgi:hypothetical protein
MIIEREEGDSFRIVATEFELDALRGLCGAAIAKKDTSGVTDEKDFTPVTLTVFCITPEPLTS